MQPWRTAGCNAEPAGQGAFGAPWLALPQPIAPSFNLGPEIIFAIVLIATLNQLDNIGCLIVMDKTDNADWRRADMQMVGRGIRGMRVRP